MRPRHLLPLLFLASANAASLSGCAGSSYTAQGAVYGGAGGAMSGALTGAFWGLVFGDAGTGAAVGAVAGGTMGAAAGASRGAQMDRVENYRRELEAERAAAAAPPPPRNPQDVYAARFDVDDLVERFGETTVLGLQKLIECDHREALRLARLAQEQGKNPEHVTAAVWLEALVYDDSAQFELRDVTYARIAEQDVTLDTPAAAATEAQKVLTEIARTRADLGRTVRCN